MRLTESRDVALNLALFCRDVTIDSIVRNYGSQFVSRFAIDGESDVALFAVELPAAS